MGFRQPISANCNDCLVVMDSFTQILEAKGDIKAAIPILQKGAILDPESRAIQQVTCTPPIDRYVIEHKFSPIHVACDWFSVVTVQMHHEITAWGTQRKGHVPENAGPNTKTRNERQTFQSRSSRCTKSKCFTRFSLNRTSSIRSRIQFCLLDFVNKFLSPSFIPPSVSHFRSIVQTMGLPRIDFIRCGWCCNLSL